MCVASTLDQSPTHMTPTLGPAPCMQGIGSSPIPSARGTNLVKDKYFGPYQIIEKDGELDYKLQLPTGLHIHHVLHVFYLRKKAGDQNRVIPDLPSFDEEGVVMLQSEEF